LSFLLLSFFILAFLSLIVVVVVVVALLRYGYGYTHHRHRGFSLPWFCLVWSGLGWLGSLPTYFTRLNTEKGRFRNSSCGTAKTYIHTHTTAVAINRSLEIELHALEGVSTLATYLSIYLLNGSGGRLGVKAYGGWMVWGWGLGTQ
jgi:hypothetical protein